MAMVSPEVVLPPDLAAAGDVTLFWRVKRHHGLDCLRAIFRRHSYARHTHGTYAVAGIMRGCETFYHRGAQQYAPAGAIAVVCPDELHDGAPHGGHFEYRTFYQTPELMLEIAEEIAGRPLARPPFFPLSVIEDPDLMRALTELHATLSLDGRRVSILEQDTRLVDFLGRLIARWADLDAPPLAKPDRRNIARARDYLDAHFTAEVDLPRLAAVAGLSRSHFIRAFRSETGLTPHAYQLDRRFRDASRLLERGEAPGEVAAACGFFDQSHLNRVFKARMGVTPGAYRAA